MSFQAHFNITRIMKNVYICIKNATLQSAINIKNTHFLGGGGGGGVFDRTWRIFFYKSYDDSKSILILHNLYL